MAQPLVDVRDISVDLMRRRRSEPVFSDISSQLGERQVVGIIGESGSGKTQFVRSIMGLSSLEPGVISGSAVFSVPGQAPIDVLQDVDDYSPFRPPGPGETHPVRQRIGWSWVLWRRRFRQRLQSLRELGVGFIFQDPMGALNPYLCVGTQLAEAVRVARPGASAAEAEEGVLHWLEQVHLEASRETLALYPHELSGGMAQRVMIALALAGEPHFVVADEPTTGLDSHIRREVVGLLHRIMAQGELSGIVISHDLPMIARLSDKLAVMYRGRVVEEGPIDALGDPDAPNHPYTRELKERAEDLAQGRHSTRARVDDGSPDSTGVVADPGCVYRSRCLIHRLQMVDRELCLGSPPPLHETVADGPQVACHVSDSQVLADLPSISAEYRGSGDLARPSADLAL